MTVSSTKYYNEIVDKCVSRKKFKKYGLVMIRIVISSHSRSKRLLLFEYYIVPYFHRANFAYKMWYLSMAKKHLFRFLSY